MVELVDFGCAPVPGRPTRCRLDRPAAADQRRRAGQPAHPPALRSVEGLPGAAAPSRPRIAELRRCASGVELEDGLTAPAEVRRLGEREVEICPARRPQPPGAAHGRSGGQPRSSRCAGSASARSSWAARAEGSAGGSREEEIARLWEDVRAMTEWGRSRERASDCSRCAAPRRPRPTRPRRSSVPPRADEELIERNALAPEAMVSCLFTTTERSRRRVPRRRRPQARAGLGAAYLLPARSTSRRDAAGDPGHGPLLRGPRHQARPTPISGEPRSCAPTWKRPSRRHWRPDRSDA